MILPNAETVVMPYLEGKLVLNVFDYQFPINRDNVGAR